MSIPRQAAFAPSRFHPGRRINSDPSRDSDSASAAHTDEQAEFSGRRINSDATVR